LQQALGPYFEWKRRLNTDHGLSVGTSLYLLYQNAGDSLSVGDDDALGGIFRYQGAWNFVGRGANSPGRINWRLESRFDVGGFQAPSQLSGAIGVGPLNSGFAYSHNFDLDLALINWSQNFNEQRAGYAIGRLGFDVYLDAFPFQTFSKGFINRSFILNPTMAATGIGALGAVAKGFVSDNIWVGAQMHDANAASGNFDFDTVKEGEWLKGVEIGWTPDFSRYKTDRIQFTYWEKDARALAGTSKGSGWVVSAAYQHSDKYFPFVRFGHSDGGAGAPAESAVSAGVQITRAMDQIWSIGAGWAKPSEKTYGPGLDDEMVLETSYMVQFSKNFSVTPDVQLIFNPANNPGESSVWVFSLRAILTL
jgi:porin